MRITTRATRAAASRRGSFLVVVVVLMTFMMGLTMAFFTTANSGHQEINSAGDRLRAHYLAEAAIHETLAAYASGGQAAVNGLNANGGLAGVNYQSTVTWGAAGTPVAEDLVVFRGSATVGSQAVALEVVGRMAADNPYVMGFAARTDLVLNSNSMIDSYDSSAGTYDSQLTGKWHGVGYAELNAPVSTNGDISMDSNSIILGDANPGTAGTISVSGNSKVDGGTAPLVTPLTFEPIVVPAIATSGSINVPSGTKTVPAGDHGFDDITMNSTGTLIFKGPANIVTKNIEIDSNSQVIVDSTNGPVNFYVTGDYFQNSNTYFRPTSGDPADLNLFVVGTGSQVAFESNTEFTGVIYAPDRDVRVMSYAAIYGALAAQSILGDSNATFHFDENLANGGGGGNALEVLCWRTVATP